ncbi:MAG: BMP family ABC transporter substrate-binding protein [Devosia sp.]|uniref:BMP family ABC transporter substrate-binding protein n=1 Tax=Devosia sp. TaxID=1871048 RepID=UPI001A3E90DC|nr:BMP family ABC transporter substrate-binding protein [Devosia sp.]MBL8599955.1 BMP family ABC transporter substrate-binding protein [Devosia sp.]
MGKLTTSGRRSVSRRTILQGAAALVGVGALGLRPSLAQDAGLVALVHTQAAGDNGPVDSMIAALKALGAEKGVPTRSVYAQDPATYEAIFTGLANAGAAVIVSTFNAVAEPFKALAPSYPNTKWIQIFGDPMDPPIPNVVTISYDYYLGCYLSALFGAKMSATGKIGYIGGVSIPPLNADLNAMKQAVAAVGSDRSVTGAFVGSFQDPTKGHEIASQMFQDGVDYIQTDAAATNNGIIQAASEGANRMVSAGSPPEFEVGPQTVISIVNLDFGKSLTLEVTKALGSDWVGGTHVHTGLGTGVVEFQLSPTFLEKGPADLVAKAESVWPEIEQAKADIVSGKLKVEFNTVV